MALTLYFHPLASFCHKVLLALYENGTPFEGRIVDLADKGASAEMLAYWPVGKFPVLRDEERGRTIADCSAAPALFYAGILHPFGSEHRHLAAYFERLYERPSFARVIEEARPYFGNFPYIEDMPARFLTGKS